MDERRLAAGALGALAVLAVPVVAVAAVLGGTAAVAAAGAGLVLVGVLFGGSAALLAWVVRRRPRRVAGVLLAGVVARLAFYGVALGALAQMDWLHRPSLAGTTAVAVTVTLAYELRLVSRLPRLFWVDAHAGPTAAVPTPTRSQAL